MVSSSMYSVASLCGSDASLLSSRITSFVTLCCTVSDADEALPRTSFDTCLSLLCFLDTVLFFHTDVFDLSAFVSCCLFHENPRSLAFMSHNKAHLEFEQVLPGACFRYSRCRLPRCSRHHAGDAAKGIVWSDFVHEFFGLLGCFIHVMAGGDPEYKITNVMSRMKTTADVRQP